jgi:hypothetical protein
LKLKLISIREWDNKLSPQINAIGIFSLIASRNPAYKKTPVVALAFK